MNTSTSLVLGAMKNVYQTGARAALRQAHYALSNMPIFNNPLGAMNSKLALCSQSLLVDKLLHLTLPGANKWAHISQRCQHLQHFALAGTILADITGSRKWIYASVLISLPPISKGLDTIAKPAILKLFGAPEDSLDSRHTLTFTKCLLKVAQLVNVVAGAAFLCTGQLNIFGFYNLVCNADDLMQF
jgi:hypothetical protein